MFIETKSEWLENRSGNEICVCLFVFYFPFFVCVFDLSLECLMVIQCQLNRILWHFHSWCYHLKFLRGTDEINKTLKEMTCVWRYAWCWYFIQLRLRCLHNLKWKNRKVDELSGVILFAFGHVNEGFSACTSFADPMDNYESLEG